MPVERGRMDNPGDRTPALGGKREAGADAQVGAVRSLSRDPRVP